MSFKVVIPARYASTRLPGKPLEKIDGKSMLQHVYELARRSGADAVIIATDDDRIRETAEKFGAHVRMTSTEHRSGTERLAEIVDLIDEPDDGIIVNVQGDEPLLPPAVITQVAGNLAARPDVSIATLCVRLRNINELFDPAVVKVVFDARGRALYFSRAPIPWCRERFAEQPATLPVESEHYRHMGLYAYRAAFLRRNREAQTCSLEQTEVLEQLRALYHGEFIHVAVANEPPGPGIDTPDDLERVRALFAERRS